MSNVYPAGKDKSLIIYSSNNNIIIRLSCPTGMSIPLILSDDYQADLSECIHDNTLYYSYINTSGDIVVKNIMDNTCLFLLPERDFPGLNRPTLTCLNDTLLLFYMKDNLFSGRSSLHIKVLFETEDIFTVPHSLNNIKDYHVHKDGNRIIFSGDEQIYSIEKIGHINQYISCDSFEKSSYSYRQKEDLQRKIAACQAKISEQASALENIIQKYDRLMKIATEYREDALKWRGKFM